MAEAIPQPPNTIGSVSDIISKLAPLFLGSGKTSGTTTSSTTSSPGALALNQQVTQQALDNSNDPNATNDIVANIMRQAAISFAPIVGQQNSAGMYSTQTLALLAAQAQAAATGQAASAVLNFKTSQEQIAQAGATAGLNATKQTTAGSTTQTAPVVPSALTSALGIGGLGLSAASLAQKMFAQNDASNTGKNSPPNPVNAATKWAYNKLFGNSGDATSSAPVEGVDSEALSGSVQGGGGDFVPTVEGSDIFTSAGGTAVDSSGAFVPTAEGSDIFSVGTDTFDAASTAVSDFSSPLEFGADALSSAASGADAATAAGTAADATDLVAGASDAVGLAPDIADAAGGIGAAADAGAGVGEAIDVGAGAAEAADAVSVGADAASGAADVADLAGGISPAILAAPVFSLIGDFIADDQSVQGMFDTGDMSESIGSVCCTVLFQQGKLSDRLYFYNIARFKRMSQRSQNAYWLWARPLAKYISSNPNTFASKATGWLFRSRAEFIARKGKVRGTRYKLTGILSTGIVWMVSVTCGFYLLARGQNV